MSRIDGFRLTRPSPVVTLSESASILLMNPLIQSRLVAPSIVARRPPLSSTIAAIYPAMNPASPGNPDPHTDARAQKGSTDPLASSGPAPSSSPSPSSGSQPSNPLSKDAQAQPDRSEAGGHRDRAGGEAECSFPIVGRVVRTDHREVLYDNFGRTVSETTWGGPISVIKFKYDYRDNPLYDDNSPD